MAYAAAGRPRELVRLLAEAPSDGREASRRAYGAAASLAAAVILGAVLLVTGRSYAASLLQPDTTGGELGLSAKSAEASTEEEFPYGWSILEECDVDYSIERVVHSNLGGQGPDEGEEGVVYNITENNHSAYRRSLLLKVNALRDYQCESAKNNGMRYDFGSLYVDSGKSLTAKFSFWDLDDKPVTLKMLRMTFLDFDMASDGSNKEFIIAYDEHPKAHLIARPQRNSDTTQVVSERVAGGQRFEAGISGSSSDNPRSSTDLTPLQQDKSVILSYHDVHSFRLTMGATEGTGIRSLPFSFHSNLACRKVKAAITTTAQPTAEVSRGVISKGVLLNALMAAAVMLALCCGVAGLCLWRHMKGAENQTTTKTVQTITTTFSDAWFDEEGAEERGASTTACCTGPQINTCTGPR